MNDFNIELFGNDKNMESFTKTELELQGIDSSNQYVSSFSTVMNLLNTLVGAGILGISDTFRFCGFFPSYLLLAIVAGLSFLATIMVVQLQHEYKVQSFEELAERTLGTWGSNIYSISATLFCIAALVVFIMVSSNTIQSWLKFININIETGSWYYRLLVLVYSLCIPVALTIPRDMSFLSKFSTFSIGCLFLFVGSICYKGIQILPIQGIHPTVVFGNISLGFFNSLAIYSLTFTLAVVVIPVINAGSPNIKSRLVSVGYAFFLCFLSVSLPGVIGYLIFGTTVKPVLLESFSSNDTLTIVVRAAFFVVVNASYPVVSLTVGSSISRFLFKIDKSSELLGWRRFICLFCVSVGPIIVSMFLPSIRPALSIGGALGGCLGNFIYPPLIWIVSSKKPLNSFTNILCVVFVLFGIISAIVATYESVIDAIKQLNT